MTVNGYDFIANVAENVKANSTIKATLDDVSSRLGEYNNLQWYKGRYDNGVWITDTNNSAYLEVTPGASYKIQAALNGNSPIAALKSAALPPIDGATIDNSSAEGWTSVIYPSNGTIIEGTIPDDVSYLYFYLGGSTLSRKPVKIVIDGYNVELSVVQSVVENTSKIEELQSVDNSELPTFAKEQNIRTYGHGGYTATYPFNSLMSYRDAKQHGFNWAETDAQFTLDNIPVLCHDDGLYTYARNPDGTRVGTSLTDTVFISETTYEDLLYYDFGLAKSPSLAGMKITTFEQLMQSAKRMNLSVAIEIKRNKTPTDEQIDILFDLIDKYHMRQNVNFCSAVTEALVYIHEKDPAMELTYIVSSITSAAITFVESIRGYNRVAIAADTTITDAMVLLAKQQNIPINIGPINSDSEIINANAYITQFTSNGPIAETVMLNYELSQL